jgi:hypothetical protein
MLVDVGTSYKFTNNDFDNPAIIRPEYKTDFAGQFEAETSRKLFTPGTYFLFVKNLSLPPQIITPAM